MPPHAKCTDSRLAVNPLRHSRLVPFKSQSARLTMNLPSGPCKDASVDVAKFETWVKSFVDGR